MDLNLIQQYLDNNGVYNVFFRQEDPHGIECRSSDIHLIKSFVSQGNAEKWILENGKDIVESEESNYGKPIVLTIIYYNNIGYYGEGEEPSQMNLISTNKYPTYAFTEQGYQMLIREHKSAISYNWHTDIIPHWFNYYNGKTLMKGITLEEFMDILNEFEYLANDKQEKDKLISKFERLFIGG